MREWIIREVHGANTDLPQYQLTPDRCSIPGFRYFSWNCQARWRCEAELISQQLKILSWRAMGCSSNLWVASHFSDGLLRPMTPKYFLKISKTLMEPFLPQPPVKLAANAASQLFTMKMMENGLMRMVSTMIEVLCNSINSCLINLLCCLGSNVQNLCLLSGVCPICHWP